MSTKAIAKALALFDEFANGRFPKERDEAHAELEAIRKAGVAVMRLMRAVPDDLLQDDEAGAKALCVAIAKEAP